MANIVMFRIDERLIHGQGQLWIKALGCNTVIVANDQAAEDPVQQQLMKSVVPKNIAMRFFTIEKTCEVIQKAATERTIFLVCKGTEDALKLVAGGISVKEINVGNIHRAPGKEEISQYIALGPEDKENLRELRDKYGVTFNTQTSASKESSGKIIDLNNYI